MWPACIARAREYHWYAKDTWTRPVPSYFREQNGAPAKQGHLRIQLLVRSQGGQIATWIPKSVRGAAYCVHLPTLFSKRAKETEHLTPPSLMLAAS